MESREARMRSIIPPGKKIMNFIQNSSFGLQKNTKIWYNLTKQITKKQIMRIVYLIGSVVFTVFLLILAFQNIQAYCYDLTVFFSEINASTPPTMLIFGIAVIGVITGIFYHAFISSLLSKKGDDDEEDF